MATNKKSRLAEIYRSEKKKGGGVASTLGKATVEKLDPRQMFNQRGFLAAAFPSLFKAYRAAPGGGGEKIQKLSSPLMTGDFGSLTKQITTLTAQMHEVAVNSTIIAKNTMVLPSMARDTNIIRQDISKLVKLQGGSATKKADMFFKSSKEREDAYESKFKKESGSLKAQPGTPGAGTNPADQKYSPLTAILKTLTDSMAKGVGIAALGVGIGGFFTGLALGGAAVTALGGASGVKDMMVNLAEGLEAFSGESFLRFSGILATGALFGAVTGLTTKGGAMLGMGAIGTGIGLFFSGLSVGGALGDMIGNSAGIRDMMVNFAQGLAAFNPSTLSAFNTLLAAGGIFGAVLGGVAALGGGKGVAAAAGIAGGATIGMGLIGTGIGLFLSGIAVGDKLIELITSGSSPGAALKSMLVNISDGVKSFESIDTAKILEVSKILPVLGASMMAYFGSKGISGIIGAIGERMSSVFAFIFGTENKSPLEKLSIDLQKFNNVNGDNLSKIGQGFKDLVNGIRDFSQAPAPSQTPAPSKPAGSSTPSGPAGGSKPPAPPSTPATASTPSGSSGNLSSASPLKDYGTYTPEMQSKGTMKNVTGSIIHHTGGDGVSAAISTLKQRGLSYHYIIGKDGTITQLLPEGAVGFHTKTSDKIKGLSNQNTIGISLEARDDNSVTEEQIRAATALNAELARKYGYPESNVWGHGEISSHKAPTEGKKVVAAIRISPDQAPSPTNGAAIAAASSDLSNGQRKVSAPNITVVAPQKDTKAAATSTTAMAAPIDRELNRRERILSRQTSLVA